MIFLLMISKCIAIIRTVSILEKRNDCFPLIKKQIMRSVEVKCIQCGTTQSKISW